MGKGSQVVDGLRRQRHQSEPRCVPSTLSHIQKRKFRRLASKVNADQQRAAKMPRGSLHQPPFLCSNGPPMVNRARTSRTK